MLFKRRLPATPLQTCRGILSASRSDLSLEEQVAIPALPLFPAAPSIPAPCQRRRSTRAAPLPRGEFQLHMIKPWNLGRTVHSCYFSAAFWPKSICWKDMCLERPPKSLLIGRWCYCYEATWQGHQADIFNLNPWIGRLCGRRIWARCHLCLGNPNKWVPIAKWKPQTWKIMLDHD